MVGYTTGTMVGYTTGTMVGYTTPWVYHLPTTLGTPPYPPPAHTQSVRWRVWYSGVWQGPGLRSMI